MLQMLLYSERNTLSLLFKWAGEAINTYHHRAVDLFNTKTICGWVPNWNLLKSKTTQLLINSKCHPPSVSPPPWVKFYKTMFWEVDKKWCGVNMKSWEGETRLQLCNNDENGSAAGLPLGSWPSVTAGLWQTLDRACIALPPKQDRPVSMDLDGGGRKRPADIEPHVWGTAPIWVVVRKRQTDRIISASAETSPGHWYHLAERNSGGGREAFKVSTLEGLCGLWWKSGYKLTN